MMLHRDSALTRLNALSVHGLVFNVTPACTVICSAVNIHSAIVCSRNIIVFETELAVLADTRCQTP